MYIARGIDQTQGPLGTRTISDRHCFGGFNRSALIVENGMSCASSLEKILERAYGMVKESAFLYQYKRFGLKQEQLEESLAVM